MKYLFRSFSHSFARFVPVAFLLLSLFNTHALAQGLSVKVHWTLDSTVTPSIEQCSDSGAIGGNSIIHIRFTPVPNMQGPPRIKEIRAHEVAGHTPDFIVTNPYPNFQSPPDILCGDDPNASAIYHDQFWPAAGHNGPTTITVTVEYTTYGYPYGGTVTTIYSPPITVDKQNIVITATDPVHPMPLLWDPATMTLLNISATITAAYKSKQPVTLTIYDTQQNVVRALQTPQDVTIGTGPTIVPFAWDGTITGAQPPNNVAPKGLYLFRFNAGRGVSFGDTDEEISAYLQIKPMKVAGADVNDPRYTGQDTTSNELLFQVRYHLDIESDRSASEGIIELYDPLLNLKTTIVLQAADMTPGDHETQVRIPKAAVSPIGIYTFLIHLRDSHDDKDKGHRKRWALSNSNRFAYQHANLTDPVDDNSMPQLFRGQPHPCPVAIKGIVVVTATANPVLRYTYGKGYWNAQMNWVVVTAETDILAAERVNEVSAVDPNSADTWNFRITWNQKLKRTLTAPNTELYWVAAFVITKPQQSWHERTFNVLTMARPVVGGVVPGNAYTEEIRHSPPAFTYGTTTDLKNFIERSTSGDGWHSGTDYAAAAGTVVNAAETGTVTDGAFDPWPVRQGGILDAIMDSIFQAMDAWMAANHPNQDPRDFLRVDVGFPGANSLAMPNNWSNKNNLGPNREVEHGKVNLLLLDAAGLAPNTQYDQGTVVTKYCHADEKLLNPPATGSKVDISTKVDVIGDWKYPLVEADYHDLSFKTALLPRGYFTANGTLIKLLVKATSNLVDSWTTNVGFPSLNGPHLHLEVRIPEKIHDKNLPGYAGQQDPETWLFLPFQAKQ